MVKTWISVVALFLATVLEAAGALKGPLQQDFTEGGPWQEVLGQLASLEEAPSPRTLARTLRVPKDPSGSADARNASDPQPDLNIVLRQLEDLHDSLKVITSKRNAANCPETRRWQLISAIKRMDDTIEKLGKPDSTDSAEKKIDRKEDKEEKKINPKQQKKLLRLLLQKFLSESLSPVNL